MNAPSGLFRWKINLKRLAEMLALFSSLSSQTIIELQDTEALAEGF